MEECIFCKIVNGEIPSYKVYEDDNVYAFLDIEPCTNGHTVVIPKKHVQNMDFMDEMMCAKLFFGVKKTFDVLKDKFKIESANIGLNEKEEAGQLVQHIHFHIIPRKEGDNGGSMHSIVKDLDAKNKVSSVYEMISKE
jgi:histidine triad (HIT) family protein